MPDCVDAEQWDRYVAGYHDANPGITEDVLGDALDTRGRSPYDWLVEALPAGASTVVDLACGSGPIGRLVVAPRVVGVDQSAGELERADEARSSGLLVRGRADALPMADVCVDAVAMSMALMVLCPVAAVLEEVTRVLRPGGRLVATVPVRSALPGLPPAPVFADILATLGQGSVAYPEALDGAALAERLSASGLTLCEDDVALFARTVRGPGDAERVVRSFYAPGAGRGRVVAAIDRLQSQVRSAPVRVGWRIRRIVAVR